MNHRKGKSLAILAGTLLIGAVAFAVGPRVEIDETPRSNNLPEHPQELDAYLQEAESAFSDLVPGTEKQILWHGITGEQTDIAVVHLHGFSASRQEASPFPEMLADALGANLYLSRFTGHGRGSQAMLDGSVNAWVNDTREAYDIGRMIGRRVVVTGISTGGTAAVWLMGQANTDQLSAVILLSPNFGPSELASEILTWPWGKQIAHLVIGRQRYWEPDNELQARYWTHSYPTSALLPMMGLVKLVRNQPLASIETPVLVLYSPDDQNVSPQRIETTFDKFGSAHRKLVPLFDNLGPTGHDLVGDIMAPLGTAPAVQHSLDFLEGVLDGKQAY